MDTSRKVGAILMVAGVSIGAGMLALPIAAATIGPFFSTLIMSIVAAFMLYAGIVATEVNLTLGESFSIAKMGERCFGKSVYILGIVTVILLFYSLVCAYLSGMTSILQKNLLPDGKFPDSLVSTVLGLVIGVIVYTSARAVDYSNRVFFFAKFILLGALLIMLLPYINIDLSLNKNYTPTWQDLTLLLPIFFTSFGFHGSIPSILKYAGHEKKQLSQIFLLGIIIPYLIYTLWITAITGALPPTGDNSLAFIKTSTDSLSTLFTSISNLTGSTLINYIVAGFSWCMVTSLLGVTLGLVDFFIEICSYGSSRFERLKATLYTFIPPIILLLMKSKIFVSALAFAAIALSILAIIIPSTSAFYLIRQGITEHFHYTKLWGLILLLIFGVIVIIMEITHLLS